MERYGEKKGRDRVSAKRKAEEGEGGERGAGEGGGRGEKEGEGAEGKIPLYTKRLPPPSLHPTTVDELVACMLKLLMFGLYIQQMQIL